MLLEICRNERCGELSSIWWVQTHEKSEGFGEVLMRKNVDLWCEHTEVTSGKGNWVNRFTRL